MFYNKLFWLSMAFLLLLHEGVQAKECCNEKTVGDVSYSLLTEDFTGSLPPQCINSCVYTKTGTLSPKFCFARGDLPTECLSETFAETLSLGCKVEVGYDYFGHDIPPPVQTSGAHECACVCTNTLGCSFWSYRISDGTCWPKYSKAGRTPNNDRISGNLACCNTPGTGVISSYADQYRGCCSWKNITESTEKDGFYIISAPHENVIDQCRDGCTYTKIQDQNQYCFPASSADDAECNSCNQCAETDLIGSSGCGQFAGKILGFLATCTARCIFSPNAGCIVGCITDLLVDEGLPAAAIDCVCQVIPSDLC